MSGRRKFFMEKYVMEEVGILDQCSLKFSQELLFLRYLKGNLIPRLLDLFNFALRKLKIVLNFIEIEGFFSEEILTIVTFGFL